MSDLPDGWDWVKIGELASSVGNGRSVPDGPVDGYPVLRLTAIRSGRIDFTASKRGAWTAEDARPFRIRAGDLLVARGNGSKRLVGRGGIVTADAEVAFPDTMIRIRFEESRIVPAYASFMWDAPQVRKQIEGAARTTAGIYKISQRDIREVHMSLPPLDEQKRIVAAVEEHFSCLDAGVGALRRAERNAGLLNRYASDVSGGEHASWTTLGEIADVVAGVTKDKKKQNDPAFPEVPYLRVANVQRGRLALQDVATIRVPAATVRKLLLQPGDILFNEGGDRDKLGRGWVWEGQVPGCIHQNHVFRARLRDDDFDPKFVSMHGNSFGQAWFEEHGKQSVNLASISQATLRAFPVPRIELGEQHRLVAEAEQRLSHIAALSESVSVALRRADSLKSAILSAAFSGRLTEGTAA